MSSELQFNQNKPAHVPYSFGHNSQVYKNGEKPHTEYILGRAIRNYSTTKVESYTAGDKSSADGSFDKSSTVTTYFDNNGEVLAKVNDIRNGKEKYTVINTLQADYFDFDSNGFIDAEDTNRIFENVVSKNDGKRSDPARLIKDKIETIKLLRKVLHFN